jgi:hypothetical protein
MVTHMNLKDYTKLKSKPVTGRQILQDLTYAIYKSQTHKRRVGWWLTAAGAKCDRGNVGQRV